MSVTGIGATPSGSASSSNTATPTLSQVQQTANQLIEQGGKAAVTQGASAFEPLIAYLKTLPASILSQSAGVINGQPATWGDQLQYWTVTVGLEEQQQNLESSGAASVLRQQSGVGLTNGDRVDEYISTLIGNIGTNVPGAFSTAEAFLARLQNPKDTVTISAAALAKATAVEKAAFKAEWGSGGESWNAVSED